MLKTARWILIFVLCLLPAAWLGYAVWLAWTGGENLLGTDPAKTLALETGQWAIRMLLLALAVTPLRQLLNQPWIWQFRRMLGLYAFFYVCLHFLVFLAFLLQWQWTELVQEIVERPYVTLGFAALLLLLPLALTSTRGMKRRLGKNWKKLHRLVYAVGVLAVLHVIWIVRSSSADAWLYGSILVILLGYRVLASRVPAVRRFSLPRRDKAVVKKM